MTIKANAVNIVTPIAETESFVVKMNKLIADTNLAHKQHKAQIGLWTEEGGREDEENLADEEKSELFRLFYFFMKKIIEGNLL
jgi:hypothetical protein